MLPLLKHPRSGMKVNLLVILIFTFGLPAMAQTAKLTRGPYLQTVNPTGITVRWRTDKPTNSVVRFGTTAGQLTQTTTDANSVTDHSVTLKGLPSATRFYYAVGASAGDVAGPATDQFFTTAPPAGSTKSVRFWALGDFGAGSDRQRGTLDAFVKATQTKPVDAWIWLGDNAYSYGRDDEFQKWVFDFYPNQLKNIPFWPAPGNHDYHDNSNDYTIPYYELTTTPQQAEAGGIPSNSKSYYSADYGPVHLVALDSYGNEDRKFRLYDTTGTQAQWLKRDLAANKLPWTIVFWHHPPYTKGSHNSDTEKDLEQLREAVTPILERYNVDLALFGHSHVYERSYLMRGHQGMANTFVKKQHAVDTTTGRYDGSPNSCPIIRKNEGVVYVVNGSGGANRGQSAGYPHPAMVYSNAQLGGSMLIEVAENRLDAQWIAEDNTVGDQFTIVKNVNQRQTLTLKTGESATLTASWPGDYRWSNGQTGRTISASTAGTYTVTDDKNCLRDEFVVTVPVIVTGTDPLPGGQFNVYPNPGNGRVMVELSLPKPGDVTLRLTDNRGAVVWQRQLSHIQQHREELTLAEGSPFFLLTVQTDGKTLTRKIVRQ